jgi:hypothetical protein
VNRKWMLQFAHGAFVLPRNKARAVNGHVHVPVHVKVNVLENSDLPLNK